MLVLQNTINSRRKKWSLSKNLQLQESHLHLSMIEMLTGMEACFWELLQKQSSEFHFVWWSFCVTISEDRSKRNPYLPHIFHEVVHWSLTETHYQSSWRDSVWPWHHSESPLLCYLWYYLLCLCGDVAIPLMREKTFIPRANHHFHFLVIKDDAKSLLELRISQRKID